MYEQQQQPGYWAQESDFYATRPNDLISLRNSDWQILEGEPNIIGWALVDRDARDVGTIVDLLVDPSTQQAVFAVVGQGTPSGTGGGTTDTANRLLVPMERIELQEGNSRAVFHGTVDEVAGGRGYTDDTRDFGPYYDYWAGIAASGGAAAAATPATENTERLAAGETHVIPEAEEHLEVGKHKEQTGTVEIHKKAEMVPQTVRETVKRTRVTVTEKDVPARELQPGEIVLHEGEAIEIPVVEEELVIEKRPRVTKKVVITPEIVEEEKEITEQVRREHVEIERHGRTDVLEEGEEVRHQAPGP